MDVTISIYAGETLLSRGDFTLAQLDFMAEQALFGKGVSKSLGVVLDEALDKAREIERETE